MYLHSFFIIIYNPFCMIMSCLNIYCILAKIQQFKVYNLLICYCIGICCDNIYHINLGYTFYVTTVSGSEHSHTICIMFTLTYIDTSNNMNCFTNKTQNADSHIFSPRLVKVSIYTNITIAYS